MKRFAILIPMMLLSGCSFFGQNNNQVEKHDWIDERDYQYTNKLVKPSSTVHNMEEMEAICDYHAFYKTKTFKVTLADDYQKSVTWRNGIKYELNYLYWHNELINGMMGMGTEINGNTWTFTYEFYNNASRTSNPYYKSANNLFAQHNKTRESFNFATDSEDLPACDVATTQQLFYAVEHGYRPICIEGSPAEKYYQKSKDLLNSIMGDAETDFDKYATIYDYISNNSTYDLTSAYDIEDAPNPDLYPDEYCALYRCFYIEGFFDEHLLVCDGYSKIMTLLGRMEGIEVYRASGISPKTYESRSEAGHAYNFVVIDDATYLSDITWGNTCYYGRYEMLDHNYFLTAHDAIAPYTSTEWPDIQENLYQNVPTGVADPFGTKEKYFKSQKYSYNDTEYSLYITSENVNTFASALQAKLSSTTGYCFANFYVEDTSLVNTIKGLITSSGTSYYSIGERDTAAEIFFQRS